MKGVRKYNQVEDFSGTKWNEKERHQFSFWDDMNFRKFSQVFP